MIDETVPPPADEYSAPIPQGASTAPAPTTAPTDEYSTPIPQGAAAHPIVPDSLDTNNPNHSWVGNQMREINALGSGIGQGVLGGVAGAAHIAGKAAFAVPEALHSVLPDGLNKVVQENKQKFAGVEHAITAKKDELQQQNSQNPGINSLGQGVESLAEFLIPGEGEVNAAGKAMSYADRLVEGVKAAKMLEGRPILQKIMKAGVKALAAGGEQGAIQGAQTFVHSGGDVGEAAKSAAAAGVVGGALGAGGSLVSDALAKGGEAAKAVQGLEDTATQAAPAKEVSQDLADTINKNHASLKSDYGETLRDFQDRTQGTTVPYAESPLHKTVQSLLGEGKTEATAFDKAENISRPGSDKANSLLKGYADLAKTPEPKVDTWVDADGVKHTETVPSPDAEPVDLDMKTLLDRRRVIGERLRGTVGSSSEDLADKKLYSKLLGGIDDTIDNLVQKTGDPEISSEYQHLRQNYREHINAFDDPVVSRITDPRGTPDDVAKAFVGLVQKSGLPQSGKVQQSLNTLEKVLDPTGTQGDAPLRQFGDQVFRSILKDATPDKGTFNASKFMDTWGKIDPETKSRLFGAGNLPEGAQGAKSFVDTLTTDAEGVRNVQRLTRMGLIASPVAWAAAAHPVGLGVLGTAALIGETSGVHASRNFIDFIANHPQMWNLFRKGAKLAENPEAQQGARDMVRVTSHEAGQAVEDDKK